MLTQFTFSIVFLGFLAAAFFAWYFTHKAREKERMLLIEKGLDVPEDKGGWSFSFKFPWLKMGIVVTGLSFGLLLGSVLREVISSRIDFEPLLMFMFGGIGMIIAHYIDRKDN